MILSWFIDNDAATKAMKRNVLIEEHDVEARPECVPMKCLDENVKKILHSRYMDGSTECNESYASKKKMGLCCILSPAEYK